VIAVAVFALLALGAAIPIWLASRGGGPASPAATAAASGTFALETDPADAVIYLDDRRIGLGSFSDRVAAGVTHHFRLSAPAYADSGITVRVAAGETRNARIALRPLLGDLSIATTPAGAEVRVDGTPRGKSPIVVRGLMAARPARVEASLTGFGMAQGTFAVAPGRMSPVSLRLAVGTADLVIATDPPGGEIVIDRASRGQSPLRIRLPLGEHRFAAVREGFTPAETTLVVSETTSHLDFRLRAAPPGVLVVQGDHPAQIYLNGVLIAENVPNSGPRELPPGTHQVHIVTVSGETIDQAVTIHSGERATFDFSKGAVTRRAP
jgi:hypothetical protein